MVRDDKNPSHPATVVRVPADAPMHKGRERPVTVSFGWKHPAVATYADGRTVTVDDQLSLVRLVGFVDEPPCRVTFAYWQEVGEDDEAYRIRSLPRTEYNDFDTDGRRIPGRWQIRLDWGRAYVLFRGEPMGTCAVTPVGDARVRIDPFDGQPEHTLGSIEFLAKIVAGEPVGEPFDDES
jgi:hypothetical protein